MRRVPVLFRLVALLLLAWILGDMFGTGLCPESVDPCCAHHHHQQRTSESGLPHGQHTGMPAVHVGHCLGHGVVTLSPVVELTPCWLLLWHADPSGPTAVDPGATRLIFHPPPALA